MEVTGLITALIVGLIIGALGRLVAPGRQKIPIWLTLLVGIAAALIGTALAAAIGVAVTPGIDWIELIIQVVLAAVGVTTADGLYGRRSVTTEWVAAPILTCASSTKTGKVTGDGGSRPSLAEARTGQPSTPRRANRG